MAHPRGTPHRDGDLDREDLPPPPPTGSTRTVDPHRKRADHDDTRHPGGLTERVTRSCSRPADINVLMNVFSSSRSKSGLAWASCFLEQASRVDTGVDGHRGVLLRVGFRRSLEGSPGGRRLLRRHAHRGAVHHSAGLHCRLAPRCNSSWVLRTVGASAAGSNLHADLATLPRVLQAYIALVGRPETARQIDAKTRHASPPPARPGGRSPWGPTSVGCDGPWGASANVAVLGIAAANGHPISFWIFTKSGLAPPHRRLMGYVALQDSVLA